MTNLFKDMKGKKQQFTQKIMDGITRVLADTDKNVESSDAKEFSRFITEQILNIGTNMNGENQNKYSPQMMQIAMAIWSRSKSASSNLEESNLFMFPSSRALYAKKNWVNYIRDITP